MEKPGQKLKKMERSNMTIAALADELHISRQAVYKRIGSYKRNKPRNSGKNNTEHRPPHNKIPAETENVVVSVASKNKDDSILTLTSRLRENHGITLSPATVFRILKRNSVGKGSVNSPASFTPPDFPVEVFHSSLVSKVNSSSLLFGDVFSGRILRKIGSAILVLFVAVLFAHGVYRPLDDTRPVSFAVGTGSAMSTPDFYYPQLASISALPQIGDGIFDRLAPSLGSFSSYEFWQGIRIASKGTLSIARDMPNTRQSSFKDVNRGMVLGISVSAETSDSGFRKSTVPFVDRLSLSLYCSLASLSPSFDRSRCDYGAIAEGRVGTQPAVDSEQLTVNSNVNPTSLPTGNWSLATEEVGAAKTFDKTQPSPIYITKYITEYVGIPGPAGSDGRDGKDGTNGTNGLAVSNTQIQPSYSGFIYPTTPTTPIGISTIGYLKDTTIDTPTINSGSATNFSLSAPTLTNAVFNGFSLFNDTVNFTGSVAINNLTATSSNFLDTTVTNSTTTNAFVTNLFTTAATSTDSYITRLVAASSTLTDAMLTNSTTTNAYVASLVAASSTLTDILGTNAVITNATFANSTTTRAYVESLTIGTSTAGALTLNGDLTVNGTSTLATTTATSLVATNATTTSLFSSLLEAVTSIITDLTATNATTTNLFTTNSVLTNSTTTNAFIQTLRIGNQEASDAVFTNATTTNLFTQNLSVGNASIQGNQTVDGAFNVTGTSTLGANVFLNGNVVIGTSTNEMFTVNALVNSNFVPAQNKVYDMGSPSFYWRTVYSDTINVNTLAAASTTISGTSNNEFTINSDNNTGDIEDSNLIFMRGLVTPNALLRWNSTTKRLESNMSLRVQNETPSTGTTTLTVQAGAGQTATNLFELLNYAGSKLSVFNANGWLGLGSSTPGSMLTVVGTSTLATTTINGVLTVNGNTNINQGGTLTVGDKVIAPGEIGAGTSSPSGKISIQNTLTDQVAFLIYGSSTQNAPLIDVFDYPGSNQSIFRVSPIGLITGKQINISGTSTFATAGGNVGIGTNAPIYALDIRGDVARVWASGSSDATFRLVEGGSQDFNLKVFNSNGRLGIVNNDVTTEVMSILQSGNVGIGTTSPTSVLQVKAAGTTSNGGISVLSSTNTDKIFSLQDSYSGNRGLLGIYSSGAAKIVMDAGGDSYFNSGNVGIGTSTPSAKLDVAGNVLIERGGSADVQRTLTIGGAKLGSGGEYSRLDFQNYDSNGLAADYVGARISSQNTSGSDVGDLRFWTMPSSGGSLTERMTILNNGNVGIGTTTPAAKMHISGGGMLLDNNYFLNSYRTDGVLANLIGLDTNNFTSIHSSGSSYGVKVTNTVGGELLTILNSGNVGIGTTTPDSSLTISGVNNPRISVVSAGGGSGAFQMNGYVNYDSQNSYGWTGYNGYNIIRGRTYNGYGDVYVGRGDAISIMGSSGNVGIGTTSPSSLLHLSKNTGSEVILDTVGGTNANSVISFYENTVDRGSIYWDGLANDFVWESSLGDISLMPSGNVGIGTTTPQSKLHIDGASALRLTNGTPGIDILQSNATTWGMYNVGSNTNFSFVNQNVGIGTTSPTGKLTVTGSAGDFIIESSGAALAFTRSSATNYLKLLNSGEFRITPDASGSTSFFEVKSDGKIGIGTTTPGAGLEVYKDSVGSVVASFVQASTAPISGNVIKISRTNGVSPGNRNATNAGLLVVDHVANTPLAVQTTAAVDLFYVNGSGNGYFAGNVGIGATSPNAKLDVLGDVQIRQAGQSYGLLRADNVNYGTGGAIQLNASNTAADQYVAFGTTPSGSTGNATFTEKMRILSSGNVGIGTTTPSELLNLYASSGSKAILLNTAGGNSNATIKLQNDAQIWEFGNFGSSNDAYQIRNSGKIPFAIESNASSDSFYISSAGNVGIGTTTPLTKLHLYTSNATSSLIIGGGDDDDPVTLWLASDSRSFNTGAAGMRGTKLSFYDEVVDAFAISTYTNSVKGVDALVIPRATGNVGIGTTNPLGKLEIEGGADSAPATSGTSSDFIFRYSPTGTNLALDFGGSASGGVYSWVQSRNAVAYSSNYALALNPNGGNVGIGTTNPATRFEVQSNGDVYTARLANNATSTAARAAIEFVNDNGTQVGYVGAHGTQTAGGIGFANATVLQGVTTAGLRLIASNASGFFTVNTGGTGSINERIRIDASGNVGIGTTTPTIKLDVSSGNDGTAGLRVAGTAIDSKLSPSTLSLNNSLGLTNGSTISGTAGQLTYNSSANGHIWQVGGAEKMRVSSTGNIGIGTTSPGAKLHIENNTSANIGQYIVNTSTGSAAAEIIYLSEEGTPATKAGALFHTNTNYNDTGIVGPSGTYLDSFDVNGLWLGSRNSLGEVHLFTGGSAANNERMTITSSGNIGVGTTTPVSKLHVAAAPADYITAVFTDTRSSSIRGPHLGFSDGAGGAATIGMLFGGTDYRDKAMEIRTAVGGRINFYKDNSTTEGNLLMTMLSNGNVGIGTTSPDAKLMVSTSDSTQLRLHRDSNTVGTATNLTFALDDSLGNPTNYASIQTLIVANNDGAEKGKLSFNTAATGGVLTQRMVIDEIGNVGIGTTSPASKFHVSGGNMLVDNTFGLNGYNSVGVVRNLISVNSSNIVNIGANSGDMSTLNLNGGSGGVAGINFVVGTANTAVRIDNSGNVGIGTTAPLNPLHVASSQANKVVAFFNNTDTADGNGLFIRGGGSNLGKYALSVQDAASNDLVRVLANGNVGIGTTTPETALDVVGSITSSAIVKSGTYFSANNVGYIRGDTAGSLRIQGGSTNTEFRNNANNATLVTILNEGNIGIGTTGPTYKFQISGTAGAGGVARIGSIDYGTTTVLSIAPGSVYFDAPGVVGGRMTINGSTGNVGIGTTSPSQKLHIVGLDSAPSTSGSAIDGVLRIGASITNIVLDSGVKSGGGPYSWLQSRNQTTYSANYNLALNPNGGNVGIGTTTPGSKLDVYYATSTASTDIFRLLSDVSGSGNVKFRVNAQGDIFNDGAATISNPADVAESYSALEAVDAGTVVAFGSTTIAWSSTEGSATSTASSSDIYEIAGVRKALDGYEAVGVVSTRPGLHLGADIQNGVPVALSGRVPVKVTAENGLVLRGDYLTVSPTRPGYAMKLTGEGRSIGRALSDYEVGRDKVMMMVENGFQKLDTAGRYATTTGMLTVGNIDLNANGVAIYNIKGLASANGTWSIDENGRITAKMLCLEDVCIDKTQLSNILNSTGQTGTVITDQSSVSSSTDTGMVAGTSTQSTDNGTQSTGSTSADAGISNDSIINIQTLDTTNTVTSDTVSTMTSDPSKTTIIDTTVVEPLPDPEPVATESVPAAEPIAEPAV